MLELDTYLSHPLLVFHVLLLQRYPKEMRYPAITVVPGSNLFQEFVAVGLGAPGRICRCSHDTSHCTWVIISFLILCYWVLVTIKKV